MRVVGIRAEKGREPTIPEAYVPLRLAPYLDENARNTDKSRKIPTVGSPQINQLPLSLQDKHWFIEDILQRNHALVVLGDPGAGKSTLLKYLITRSTEPPKTGRSIISCPLYVSLRSCRTQNNTLLEDTLDRKTKILDGILPSNLVDKKMPEGFIQSCVEKGRALLLLDGLDEVANEEIYADVIRKINDFYLSYPENRIVVTCRIAGWHSGLRGDFVLYHALPLDRQQQHDFIARWYETAYKQNKDDETSTLLEEEKLVGLDLLRDERKLSATEEASALEHLFGERDRLAKLAANPLLLSLICLVYHLRHDLPRGRAALYDECVEILLGVWDRIDKGLNISKPTTDEKRKILRHVAFMLHNSGKKDISRQDFVSLVMNDLGMSEEMARIVVRQIEVRSWLIVERVIDRLAFSHLTLQEFFVVEYLHTEKQDVIDLATIKDWNLWREPLLLMCGQSTDPTTFIEQIAPHNIIVAILCIPEADSTLLAVQRINHLLGDALSQVQEGKLALTDLLPALSSLEDEMRITWAESWACRLALAENDYLMRTIPYNDPIYTEIWPYRKSQHTVLAAIVQKCVQILQTEKRYGDTEQQQKEFVDSIEHIAQFDLRVQIPLLVRLGVSEIHVEDSRDQERLASALGIKHRDYALIRFYTSKEAWYALVTAGGRRNDDNFWQRVGKWIGTFGQFGSYILQWAGVVTLLWNFLSSWLSGILMFAAMLWIIFLLSWMKTDDDEFVRLLATKKMNSWHPIALLIMVAVCGVLGGFAVHAWFHLALPLSILIVGLGCLLSTALHGWMSALSAKSMLPWLEQHPRGQAVLDELRG